MAVERTIWCTMVVDFVKAAIFAVRGSEREGGPPTLSGTAAPSGVGGGSRGMVPPRWKRRQWRRRVSITVLCLDNAIITAFHHTLRPKLASNEVTIMGSPYPSAANRGSRYERLWGCTSMRMATMTTTTTMMITTTVTTMTMTMTTTVMTTITMTMTMTTSTVTATHEIQVAVETSEDRRNRNETGWSSILPAYNASCFLFLVESSNTEVAQEYCIVDWLILYLYETVWPDRIRCFRDMSIMLDLHNNANFRIQLHSGKIRFSARWLAENGHLISTRSLDRLVS